MSEFSKIKTALDSISQQIVTARTEAAAAKEGLTNAKGRLASLPDTHAAVIATLQSYVGSSNAAEATAHAQFQKLVAEYSQLSGDLADAIAAL